MPIEPVLIAGQWRPSASKKTFRSENPATREALPPEYPVSDWADCEAVLAAAAAAAQEIARLTGRDHRKVSGRLRRAD